MASSRTRDSRTAAANRSSSADGRPAACRSSRITASGAARDAWSRTVQTASNSVSLAPGPDSAGARARAELGEELAEHAGLRAGRVGERLRPGLPGVASQHLHPGPVRRGAAVLPGAAPEHQRAVGGGRPGEGAGQLGLADARLARDQRQPGVTGGRLAQE